MQNRILTSALAAVAAAFLMTHAAGAQSASSPGEVASGLQPEIGAGSPSHHSYLYQPAPLASSGIGASSPPVSRGPITGYGRGGMGYAPGSASNAPYFYGGAGARR
jgi:hypothetical protein